MPDRVAGDAGGIKVGLAMADRAAHGGKPISVRSTPDRGLVEPARIALTRTVAGRMAVHAARMREHLAEFREYCR